MARCGSKNDSLCNYYWCWANITTHGSTTAHVRPAAQTEHTHTHTAFSLIVTSLVQCCGTNRVQSWWVWGRGTGDICDEDADTLRTHRVLWWTALSNEAWGMELTVKWRWEGFPPFQEVTQQIWTMLMVNGLERKRESVLNNLTSVYMSRLGCWVD